MSYIYCHVKVYFVKINIETYTTRISLATLVYPSNMPRLFPPPIVFCLCVQFWSVIHILVSVQAFLVLVALHGDLDYHIHTLVAVQDYLVLVTTFT